MYFFSQTAVSGHCKKNKYLNEWKQKRRKSSRKFGKTLQESKELKNDWDKLRPSCQREYVERVKKAKSEEKRKEKIDRIIELTLDYAKRHPEKYKNRKS